MERFSRRVGIVARPQLAHDQTTDELNTALWNVLHLHIFVDVLGSDATRSVWRSSMRRIYPFLHWRLNDLEYNGFRESKRLEEWFFDDREWFERYDLIDFVVQLTRDDEVAAAFNNALQAEGSPYRFVRRVLTQIVDPVETAAIDNAVSVDDAFAGGRAHIVRALELLGQRPQPDYRNAIKEAISAVESTLKVLTGRDHADLSEALKDFRAQHPIHGALLAGLDKLYGYASNEHGLRHALLEAEAKVGHAEAKFMVVACAAFMNYLIERTSE